MMEGVNSTIIYYKNFCKCHNVPPIQQLERRKEGRMEGRKEGQKE
jgi:hypothetical protein